MKEIKLTKGQFVKVDDELFDELNSFKWFAHSKKFKFGVVHYAARNIRIDGKRKTIRMHTQIMGDNHDGMVVDHIDNDQLNNQKSNLRFVTVYQNNVNRRCTGLGTSKYKGVYWNKREKIFKAQIRKDRVNICVCRSHDEKEAALAYNEAAKRLHGDYAILNIF